MDKCVRGICQRVQRRGVYDSALYKSTFTCLLLLTEAEPKSGTILKYYHHRPLKMEAVISTVLRRVKRWSSDQY